MTPFSTKKTDKILNINKILFFITIASLLCFNALQAQTQNTIGPYTIKTSAPIKIPKKHYLKIQPMGNKGVLELGYINLVSYNFQKYDESLTRVNENTVKTEKLFNENMYSDPIFWLKNKSYLVVHETDHKKSKYGVSVAEIDYSTLSIKDNLINIFNPSAAVLNPSSGYIQRISRDRTKFLFKYTLNPTEAYTSKRIEKIGLWAFDENLVKLWGGEFMMPAPQYDMAPINQMIANDGKVYMLVKVNNKAPAKTFHYEIFVYSKDNQEPIRIVVNVDAKYYEVPVMYEDDKNNILLAGFYAKDEEDGFDGLYLSVVDVKNGQMVPYFNGKYEFLSSLSMSYNSKKELKKLEKQEEKGKGGIKYLQLRNIINTPDGSIKIIAEQENTATSLYGKQNTLTGGADFKNYCEDIIVMSIDAKGELDFTKKIPKSQFSKSSIGYWSSFNYINLSSIIK